MHLLLHSLLVPFLVSMMLILMCLPSDAAIPNTLFRVDIRPKSDFTRINIRLNNPPKYNLSVLPGNKLRLSISDTDGTLFRKFRRYSDSNIGGLLFSKRGDALLITFPIASGTGWRDLSNDSVGAITLDVGRKFKPEPPHPSLPGREKIWNGVEKLVRDFDPPIKTDFLFQPTDRMVLKTILDDEGQQAFMAAEAALYKGNLSEAEESFAQFAAKQTAIRALALYRLGETNYLLQKYPQALSAFREAEKLWPAYLGFNSGVTFYYGDSIARSGDLAGARTLLSGLICRLADKKFAPVLLVRLADILARQGQNSEAMAVYRTVAGNFQDNKANQMARLRLNDLDFMGVKSWSLNRVSSVYQDLSLKSSDMDLREEAQFKSVLLEAIHGEAAGALRQTLAFQKKFPRGVYATVCRNIREVLAGLVYRETDWSKDPASLIRFAEEQNDYLAGCIEQPDFLDKVRHAYEEAGRPIELIRLFDSLLDRQWATVAGPFIYETIADNAELLGDNLMAEKYTRAFLKKYPSHVRARIMFERLGSLNYNAGKYQETRDSLIWLLNKGERAQVPESYYYLGRSLWLLKQYKVSYKAMEMYLAQPARSDRLLPDSYFVAASAREASGDRKGAIRLLESGLKLPKNTRSDELTYKTGSLLLREGNVRQARSYFEQVIQKGSDPDWQKLSQQAIESINKGNSK